MDQPPPVTRAMQECARIVPVEMPSWMNVASSRADEDDLTRVGLDHDQRTVVIERRAADAMTRS